MKLLNRSLVYFSIALLAIMTVWAVIFYINMLDEVYDSLDDGLGNEELLVIQRAQKDTTILYHTSFNERNYSIKEIDLQTAMQIKDVYKDTMMYMIFEKDLEPVRMLSTAFERKGRYYELKVISSMVEEDDLIENLFWSLVWLYIILITSIILINNILLKKIWHPFYQILNQLTTYRLGKTKEIETIETNVTEFKELDIAVKELLSHTDETFTNQKQFIENASHELQTPLAIAINKIELLLDKSELNEEQSVSIGQTLALLQRLTNLNKTLLLLSKIENKQFIEKEEVNLNEIIKQTLLDFQDFSEFKEIEINFTENGVLEVEMNPYLASIFISNFIKNAIIHNIPNGKVEISISKSGITFCNTGKSQVLDKEKIFNRFHKEHGEQNNTGLGLSIVKSIANLYDFKVDYTFDGQHCFEIEVK
ncbi:MAG: HAMP domain-containing sensor histidine kinase [Crocinitomicaceae bacterium]